MWGKLNTAAFNICRDTSRKCPCHNSQQPRRLVYRQWLASRIFGGHQLQSSQFASSDKHLTAQGVSSLAICQRCMSHCESSKDLCQCCLYDYPSCVKVSTNLNANMFEAHLKLIGMMLKGMESKVASIYSCKMESIYSGWRAGQPLLTVTWDTSSEMNTGVKKGFLWLVFYLVFSQEMLMWLLF